MKGDVKYDFIYDSVDHTTTFGGFYRAYCRCRRRDIYYRIFRCDCMYRIYRTDYEIPFKEEKTISLNRMSGGFPPSSFFHANFASRIMET